MRPPCACGFGDLIDEMATEIQWLHLGSSTRSLFDRCIHGSAAPSKLTTWRGRVTRGNSSY
uniref:Uncharacterized protein n=1 Tax=Arundo donax TaxID=35708 RepID=A0A0A9FR30_ARUDO